MFSEPRISESKSSWDKVDESLPTMSMYRTSKVLPSPNEQFSPTTRPSDVQALVRYNNNTPYSYPPALRESWAPTIMTQNPYPTDAAKKSMLPSKKYVILASLIGAVVGLCICGVPLAVMTTLYLQQKSQTQTCSNSNGTTGTSSSSSLPSQCSAYTTISDVTRLTTCTGTYNYDCGWTAGWYRFSGSGGTQLATTPSSTLYCCTQYPGWFNGTLPSTSGTTTVVHIRFPRFL
ncbi:unnamed protein product [Adineta steineri]|uniref:Uncharacterized protein n=2 Tax=Adineta steineri TaxID=433720 RepID=A0A813S8C2_9BILA|nr:unnamed protein product [Adineta steineri]CAF0792643.1 unnamed protein product [Adineta steineri]CAF0887631.1 unnamed protein product [Adineta steineri]